MESTLSALVVPVPEAEPRVGALRAALDPTAGFGVPAHVTILFPFLPPAEIDDGVLAALGEVIGEPAFEVGFSRVAWFGEEVVWWAPEPAAPFVAMTRAVSARFGVEPYEGAHGDTVTPHLTIGHGAPLDRMRRAAAEVAAGPPVRASVRSVALMTGAPEPGAWRIVAAFPLREG